MNTMCRVVFPGTTMEDASRFPFVPLSLPLVNSQPHVTSAAPSLRIIPQSVPPPARLDCRRSPSTWPPFSMTGLPPSHSGLGTMQARETVFSVASGFVIWKSKNRTGRLLILLSPGIQGAKASIFTSSGRALCLNVY